MSKKQYNKRTKEEVKKDIEKVQQEIKNLSEEYIANPDLVLECLKFGAKFYQYSYRNTQYLLMQNPHGNYFASYKEFNKQGVRINKGEHGYKVLVPKTVTILQLENGTTVPLSKASKEEKKLYKEGKIKSNVYRYFSIGKVFEISQTDYPEEDLPKLFQQGKAEELPDAYTQGILDYIKEEFEITVDEKGLRSVTTFGLCHFDVASGKATSMKLNPKTKGVEKLNTLCHELGHALMVDTKNVQAIPVEEVKADCFAILMMHRLGLPVTETTKFHFKENFKSARELSVGNKSLFNLDEIVANAFDLYKQNIDNMTPFIDKALEKAERLQAVKKRQNLPVSEKLKAYSGLSKQHNDDVKRSLEKNMPQK